MNSMRLIGNGICTLGLGLFLLLFTESCSKSDDDCSAPDDAEPTATTRNYTDEGAPQGENLREATPPVSYRDMETGGDDAGDDGISDDGDDEADGEGNKKNKPAH